MKEKTKEIFLFILNLSLLVVLWVTINIYQKKLSFLEKRVDILENQIKVINK
jgi:hypothetical protein